MKNLILIIAFLIVAIGVQAQDITTKIKDGYTYKYNNVNVTLLDTSSYDIVWNIQSHYPFVYSLAIDIDSVSGVSSIDTLFTFGRISEEDSWSALDTVIRSSNTETVRATSLTTSRYFRQMRALYNTKDTADVTVDYFWLKLWRK